MSKLSFFKEKTKLASFQAKRTSELRAPFWLKVTSAVLIAGIIILAPQDLFSQKSQDSKGKTKSKTELPLPVQDTLTRGATAENRLPLGKTTEADTALVQVLLQRDPLLKFFYAVKVKIPKEFKSFIYIEPDVLLGSIDQGPLYLGRIKKISSKLFAYDDGTGTLVIGSPEKLVK